MKWIKNKNKIGYVDVWSEYDKDLDETKVRFHVMYKSYREKWFYRIEDVPASVLNYIRSASCTSGEKWIPPYKPYDGDFSVKFRFEKVEEKLYFGTFKHCK